MTFGDWEDIYDCAEENSRILADWKAEREKIIGALAQLLVFEDDHDAAGTEWHDAQKLAVENARVVLAEVKVKE